MPNPNELLAQLGNGNPLLSALSKHFLDARSKGAGHESADLPTDSVIDVEPEPSSCEPAPQNGHGIDRDAAECPDELREQIQSLQVEMKAVRERCDLLASALGACCLCWGQDPVCRACRGRGKPGFAIPDEAPFEEFVVPAIRVLRAQKAKHGGPPASAQPPNVSLRSQVS